MAVTPRPPNVSLYSLQPTTPWSVVILRKSKLRQAPSALSGSMRSIFMSAPVSDSAAAARPKAGSMVSCMVLAVYGVPIAHPTESRPLTGVAKGDKVAAARSGNPTAGSEVRCEATT